MSDCAHGGMGCGPSDEEWRFKKFVRRSTIYHKRGVFIRSGYLDIPSQTPLRFP